MAQYNTEPVKFIPRHGGYEKLISYQKAEIIYDGTIYFTKRFVSKSDRTSDQMVQAARSGKQNIVEASMASAMSKQTEIFLTNVARSSLEELKKDYNDFLRTNKLKAWTADHNQGTHVESPIGTTEEQSVKNMHRPYRPYRPFASKAIFL
ncbi:MAG TPA: four helix bundle protein [Bacteroidales bacterium]|nr:four helix bundle protein [Bacteroidales bacterium]